jgi:predicted anti-sigma-YlaC factor YlaD
VNDSGRRQDGAPAAEFSVADQEVTCQEFVELITDYFEGALTHRTLSQVEEHLVLCDWCVTYAGQMSDTVAALQTLRDRPPTQPSEALLKALRANTENQR